MTLRPLNDRVLVEPEKMADKMGSVILPDIAQSNSQRGTIVAVGPGKLNDDGVLLPMQVKVGDVIYYDFYGVPVSVDGKEKYLCLKESDIMAVIE